MSRSSPLLRDAGRLRGDDHRDPSGRCGETSEGCQVGASVESFFHDVGGWGGGGSGGDGGNGRDNRFEVLRGDRRGDAGEFERRGRDDDGREFAGESSSFPR
mmetsp:Transcript_27091/g.56041  ORF Transcript_27091/g.56041 Transcript_27091/m.56041 type:complete len:102 (+) Transcript_27091:1496-1801(+)